MTVTVCVCLATQSERTVGPSISDVNHVIAWLAIAIEKYRWSNVII